MRFASRFLKLILLVLLLLVMGGMLWVYAAPTALLRVGSAYAAKVVCSNVFIAGRDPDNVLSEDILPQGNRVLHLLGVQVDREHQSVRASFLGLVATRVAIYRPGIGCTVVPRKAEVVAVTAPAPVPSSATPNAPWPEGEKAEPSAGVSAVLARKNLTGTGMRAVVVVHDGRIVGETYGPGYAATTPLLGWSMTKTVNAALIGMMMKDGKLRLDDQGLMPQWQNDARRDIKLSQLLGMESGLEFQENYGSVTDVTRMLFLEGNMAKFAASRKLIAAPGQKFSYSSGTSMILSEVWMDRLDNRDAAWRYPRERLFGPLGMSSAVFEVDAAGTFAGSSYMYATARDWARFGLFLAQDGVWNGERLLPEGFVTSMNQPTAASGGRYTRLQTWLPMSEDKTRLPSDTFVLQGHDGQTVFVMPSKKLVVVRLGFTPMRTQYKAADLAAAIAKLY